MALLLALLFLVVPLAELAVIIAVADTVGVLNTIGLLVVISIAGAWLAKQQGLGVLARIRATLSRGELPSRELADGGLVLFAGALMLTPGFLTDFLAVLLLVPPTRSLVRRTLLRFIARRRSIAVVTTAGQYASGRGRRDGAEADDGIWDVESWEQPSRPAHRELGDPR
jgi:UPF0716 protein FxsA